MVIYGINPVLEALRAGRVRRLRVGPRADRRIDEALALARKRGVAVERVDAETIERAARGAVHQGVVADIDAPRDYTVAELVASAAPEPPLLVVLDGIEDPHNLGAIIRSAHALGAQGVVIPKDRAASVTSTVAKASAGAVEHCPVARVTNLAQALEKLKTAGLWTLALAGEAAEELPDVDLTLPTALVVGSEGSGVRPLVRRTCDRVVRIPMKGKVGSLNASVAASIALYEVARQRNPRNVALDKPPRGG